MLVGNLTETLLRLIEAVVSSVVKMLSGNGNGIWKIQIDVEIDMRVV